MCHATELCPGQCLVPVVLPLIGHDHAGHGRSEGIPAYIDTVDDYVDDLIDHCMVSQMSMMYKNIEKDNQFIIFRQ